MTTSSTPVRGSKQPRTTARPEWQALQRHANNNALVQMRDLFAADERRGARMAAEAAGLYLDYSKNRITDETIALL
ncbi:MAG: hypothetical protein ABI365_06460, partial [Lysobacteraceae bacterium]